MIKLGASGIHWPGQFDGDHSFWLNFDAFAPKFELGMNRPVEDKIFTVSMECGHWRMMRNLLADDPEARSFELVRLTEQRVERFAQTFPVGSQGAHCETCYVLEQNKKNKIRQFKTFVSWKICCIYQIINFYLEISVLWCRIFFAWGAQSRFTRKRLTVSCE